MLKSITSLIFYRIVLLRLRLILFYLVAKSCGLFIFCPKLSNILTLYSQLMTFLPVLFCEQTDFCILSVQSIYSTPAETLYKCKLSINI